jgi:predicted component of type VI protein secretion system
MTKLFWLQPDNTIVEFPLKAEQSLIGRGSRCDVRIKHPGISAEHAIIRLVSGVATVEDMGSTNGTRVNGKRISQMQTLRHGDQIGVGRERLMYFAELDSAALFLQPESIEPFALLAPGGEHVNTLPDADVASSTAAAALPPLPDFATASSGSPVAPVRAPAASTDEPLLDLSLIAALPKGAALVAKVPVQSAAAVTQPLAPPPKPRDVAMLTPAPAPGPTQSLTGSVAVLSGPAAGKRYLLTQASVTLGKEGKQVVEFIRASPTRWQIVQREGVTPAYINGDALAGVRDLAAGDVIELTGVRLRFEITLTAQ